ncbi:hypothetical protein MTO96_038499 [Rhipicephalus appendiculatus]
MRNSSPEDTTYRWTDEEMRRVAAVRYKLGDLATNYQTSFHVRGRTCQEVAALVSTVRFREIEAIYKRERAGDGGGGARRSRLRYSDFREDSSGAGGWSVAPSALSKND